MRSLIRGKGKKRILRLDAAELPKNVSHRVRGEKWGGALKVAVKKSRLGKVIKTNDWTKHFAISWDVRAFSLGYVAGQSGLRKIQPGPCDLGDVRSGSCVPYHGRSGYQ
jgi:hypothetical protein